MAALRPRMKPNVRFPAFGEARPAKPSYIPSKS